MGLKLFSPLGSHRPITAFGAVHSKSVAASVLGFYLRSCMKLELERFWVGFLDGF